MIGFKGELKLGDPELLSSASPGKVWAIELPEILIFRELAGIVVEVSRSRIIVRIRPTRVVIVALLVLSKKVPQEDVTITFARSLRRSIIV